MSRSNPTALFRANRASASTLRPCAPTEQPNAAPKTYRCPCGASVELAANEALPADWATVHVKARRGAPERVAYRCGKCDRRALVMSLLADDIALHTIAISDARRLANWCERAKLDERGIRVVILRLQAKRGAEAWARLVERCEVGQ